MHGESISNITKLYGVLAGICSIPALYLFTQVYTVRDDVKRIGNFGWYAPHIGSCGTYNYHFLSKLPHSLLDSLSLRTTSKEEHVNLSFIDFFQVLKAFFYLKMWSGLSPPLPLFVVSNNHFIDVAP